MDPLLSAFANQLGLTPQAARPLLDDLLAEIQTAVRTDGSITVPEIGVFQQGPDGVHFQPDDDLVAAVNQPYLGLPPITSKRPPMPSGHSTPAGGAPSSPTAIPPTASTPAPPDPVPSTADDEPPPEAPHVFAVPLESADPVDPAPTDPFGDRPPPPSLPAAPEADPLRDLSSETPSGHDAPRPLPSGDDAPAEGPTPDAIDPDLEALIAGMKAAAEPEPSSAFDFFGQSPEGGSTDPATDGDIPSTPVAAPPVEIPPTPPSARATPQNSPPPFAQTATTPPRIERRRFSPIGIILPILFLVLIAAAVWLWPRLQRDTPAEPTPSAAMEQPVLAPILATPDSAAVADSTLAQDGTAPSGGDSTLVEAPAPVEEPPPTPADDPLRGSTPIDVSQGGFGFVFGSGSRAGAEQDAARYRRQGYRAGAVRATLPSGTVTYRVILGQYPTRAAAEAARSDLPANQPQGVFITQITP